MNAIDPDVEHAAMANALRALAMDAVQQARSGHPGLPLGMADVATVLFRSFLVFDPEDPSWPDRDRFVLSAGHGSMLLYALLHLTGVADMDMEQLRRFRQLGSRTAGHPEYGHTAGVEITTGPLGQGIAGAVGMALAERLANARYGDDLVDHRTWVIAGDGCLMEGISHEAIDLAGHLGLAKLTVIWDDNAISIDGATSLTTSTDQLARFTAAGWDVRRIDGHDPEQIAAALAAVQETDRPSLIAARTIIGYGAPTKQGTAAVHGSPLGDEEIAATRAALGWDAPPFVIPDDVAAGWRAIGERGRAARADWLDRLAAAPAERRAAFEASLHGRIPDAATDALATLKARFAAEAPSLATRKSSAQALAALVPHAPAVLGGSADLSGSNGTRTAAHRPITADDFAGNYVHYGVREHGMAACMNGLALHGGFVPYGGTFLVFSDYSRPAIRLAALMGVRVVHVMTHDSIGLGEDGPTHQPVEHLAALRAIPNTFVFRPADAVECVEAWQCALSMDDAPSVLALTRQNLPTVRVDAGADNRVARGAYVLREPDHARDVTLLASGSEVEIALAAADELAAEGIHAAVVSMPCWELFERQPASYRASVLGDAPRVAVEAAIGQGWWRWLGERGTFVGMESFGASAPAAQLYEHFGITPGRVAAAARNLIP